MLLMCKVCYYYYYYYLYFSVTSSIVTCPEVERAVTTRLYGKLNAIPVKNKTRNHLEGNFCNTLISGVNSISGYGDERVMGQKSQTR